MALLNASKNKSKRIPVTIILEEQLLNEINSYCQWAEINHRSEFFLQAIHFILRNDKDWKRIQQQKGEKLINE